MITLNTLSLRATALLDLSQIVASALDFVVALDRLLIGRWHAPFCRSFSFLLLLLRWYPHPLSSPIASLLLRTTDVTVGLPLWRTLLPQGFTTRSVVDIIICDPSIFALVMGNGLIFIVARFRVQGDDVPGMDEPRKIAKHAEEDVDERVRAANS